MSEILLYQNPDGNIKIDVRLENETVWLTREQIANLFGKGRSTITEHIGNFFKEGELNEQVACRNFRLTTPLGAIDGKIQEKDVKHYNLDVIISVGYRVKSLQGAQFRIWATKRLKEYIIKGFTLNDDHFKSGSSMNNFNELQDRIRKIRLSEKFFYQIRASSEKTKTADFYRFGPGSPKGEPLKISSLRIVDFLNLVEMVFFGVCSNNKRHLRHEYRL